MYVLYIRSVYGMTLRYVSMIEEGYKAGLVSKCCVSSNARRREGIRKRGLARVDT